MVNLQSWVVWATINIEVFFFSTTMMLHFVDKDGLTGSDTVLVEHEIILGATCFYFCPYLSSLVYVKKFHIDI